jgi:hypothetical protein
MKKFRVWIEDSVEKDGGVWWYCFQDENGFLRQEGYDYTNKEDELDTLEQYIEWEYKIEQL